MAPEPEWTSEEAAFLERVATIVRVNPFGAERARLDRELTELAGVDAGGERFALLAIALHRQIQAFEQSGKYDLRMYHGEKRQLLFLVLLFDIFLRFKQPFLSLIEAQKQSEENLKWPFASTVLAYLRDHGVTEDESLELLAHCYQIRRAYHFIDDSLVGRSPSMIQLRMELWRNVFTHHAWWYRRLHRKLQDFSTLLLGETGTGKGAAARAMGLSSHIPFVESEGQFLAPFEDQFVAINLSEFPEGLLESELFGHRKGAFTGALQSHEGVLSRGRPHGCIFFDELGDLSLHLQVKLLQVIQQRVFSPVGSHQTLPLHGRLISATHQPIHKLLATGQFREDFYYRLCTNEISLPPLRQRIAEEPDELKELVALIVARIVGAPDDEMADFAMEAITEASGFSYDWPGNVRELEQCTRRILLTGSATSLTPGYKPDELALIERLHRGIEGGSYEARELLREYCQLLYQRSGSYQDVARQTNLDRRTVKKYITHEKEGA